MDESKRFSKSNSASNIVVNPKTGKEYDLSNPFIKALYETEMETTSNERSNLYDSTKKNTTVVPVNQVFNLITPAAVSQPVQPNPIQPKTIQVRPSQSNDCFALLDSDAAPGPIKNPMIPLNRSVTNPSTSVPTSVGTAIGNPYNPSPIVHRERTVPVYNPIQFAMTSAMNQVNDVEPIMNTSARIVVHHYSFKNDELLVTFMLAKINLEEIILEDHDVLRFKQYRDAIKTYLAIRDVSAFVQSYHFAKTDVIAEFHVPTTANNAAAISIYNELLKLRVVDRIETVMLQSLSLTKTTKVAATIQSTDDTVDSVFKELALESSVYLFVVSRILREFYKGDNTLDSLFLTLEKNVNLISSLYNLSNGVAVNGFINGTEKLDIKDKTSVLNFISKTLDDNFGKIFEQDKVSDYTFENIAVDINKLDTIFPKISEQLSVTELDKLKMLILKSTDTTKAKSTGFLNFAYYNKLQVYLNNIKRDYNSKVNKTKTALTESLIKNYKNTLQTFADSAHSILSNSSVHHYVSVDDKNIVDVTNGKMYKYSDRLDHLNFIETRSRLTSKRSKLVYEMMNKNFILGSCSDNIPKTIFVQHKKEERKKYIDFVPANVDVDNLYSIKDFIKKEIKTPNFATYENYVYTNYDNLNIKTNIDLTTIGRKYKKLSEIEAAQTKEFYRAPNLFDSTSDKTYYDDSNFEYKIELLLEFVKSIDSSIFGVNYLNFTDSKFLKKLRKIHDMKSEILVILKNACRVYEQYFKGFKRIMSFEDQSFNSEWYFNTFALLVNAAVFNANSIVKYLLLNSANDNDVKIEFYSTQELTSQDFTLDLVKLDLVDFLGTNKNSPIRFDKDFIKHLSFLLEDKYHSYDNIYANYKIQKYNKTLYLQEYKLGNVLISNRLNTLSEKWYELDDTLLELTLEYDTAFDKVLEFTRKYGIDVDPAKFKILQKLVKDNMNGQLNINIPFSFKNELQIEIDDFLKRTDGMLVQRNVTPTIRDKIGQFESLNLIRPLMSRPGSPALPPPPDSNMLINFDAPASFIFPSAPSMLPGFNQEDVFGSLEDLREMDEPRSLIVPASPISMTSLNSGNRSHSPNGIPKESFVISEPEFRNHQPMVRSVSPMITIPRGITRAADLPIEEQFNNNPIVVNPNVPKTLPPIPAQVAVRPQSPSQNNQSVNVIHPELLPSPPPPPPLPSLNYIPDTKNIVNTPKEPPAAPKKIVIQKKLDNDLKDALNKRSSKFHAIDSESESEMSSNEFEDGVSFKDYNIVSKPKAVQREKPSINIGNALMSTLGKITNGMVEDKTQPKPNLKRVKVNLPNTVPQSGLKVQDNAIKALQDVSAPPKAIPQVIPKPVPAVKPAVGVKPNIAKLQQIIKPTQNTLLKVVPKITPQVSVQNVPQVVPQDPINDVPKNIPKNVPMIVPPGVPQIRNQIVPQVNPQPVVPQVVPQQNPRRSPSPIVRPVSPQQNVQPRSVSPLIPDRPKSPVPRAVSPKPATPIAPKRSLTRTKSSESDKETFAPINPAPTQPQNEIVVHKPVPVQTPKNKFNANGTTIFDKFFYNDSTKRIYENSNENNLDKNLKTINPKVSERLILSQYCDFSSFFTKFYYIFAKPQINIVNVTNIAPVLNYDSLAESLIQDITDIRFTFYPMKARMAYIINYLGQFYSDKLLLITLNQFQSSKKWELYEKSKLYSRQELVKYKSTIEKELILCLIFLYVEKSGVVFTKNIVNNVDEKIINAFRINDVSGAGKEEKDAAIKSFYDTKSVVNNQRNINYSHSSVGFEFVGRHRFENFQSPFYRQITAKDLPTQIAEFNKKSDQEKFKIITDVRFNSTLNNNSLLYWFIFGSKQSEVEVQDPSKSRTDNLFVEEMIRAIENKNSAVIEQNIKKLSYSIYKNKLHYFTLCHYFGLLSSLDKYNNTLIAVNSFYIKAKTILKTFMKTTRNSKVPQNIIAVNTIVDEVESVIKNLRNMESVSEIIYNECFKQEIKKVKKDEKWSGDIDQILLTILSNSIQEVTGVQVLNTILEQVLNAIKKINDFYVREKGKLVTLEDYNTVIKVLQENSCTYTQIYKDLQDFNLTKFNLFDDKITGNLNQELYTILTNTVKEAAINV
ncbi:hypothetical protein [Carp edema virus]|nr:hypothetical protein [Carp edema virus]